MFLVNQLFSLAHYELYSQTSSSPNSTGSTPLNVVASTRTSELVISVFLAGLMFPWPIKAYCNCNQCIAHPDYLKAFSMDFLLELMGGQFFCYYHLNEEHTSYVYTSYICKAWCFQSSCKKLKIFILEARLKSNVQNNGINTKYWLHFP